MNFIRRFNRKKIFQTTIFNFIDVFEVGSTCTEVGNTGKISAQYLLNFYADKLIIIIIIIITMEIIYWVNIIQAILPAVN